MKTRSRTTVVVTILVAVASLVTVVGLLALGAPTPGEGRSTASDTSDPTSTPTPATPTTSRSAGSDGGELVVAEGDQPVPTRVRVPAIGVDSPLDALTVDHRGALRAPSRWQRAGWFADGTRPGDPGPAVVAGHVDSPDGPAVFARLAEVGPGDVIDVVRRGGTTARFRVDRTQVVGKREFPTDAVYGPTPDSQLRLITCDGPYVESSGGYQDNLIVFATKVTP